MQCALLTLLPNLCSSVSISACPIVMVVSLSAGPWAARSTTWLLIKSTSKGVVFSCLCSLSSSVACNAGSGASSSTLYRPPPPPSQGGLPPPGGLPPGGSLPPFAGGYPSSRNQWVPPMGGLPPPAYLAGNHSSSRLQSFPMDPTTEKYLIDQWECALMY